MKLEKLNKENEKMEGERRKKHENKTKTLEIRRKKATPFNGPVAKIYKEDAFFALSILLYFGCCVRVYSNVFCSLFFGSLFACGSEKSISRCGSVLSVYVQQPSNRAPNSIEHTNFSLYIREKSRATEKER